MWLCAIGPRLKKNSKQFSFHFFEFSVIEITQDSIVHTPYVWILWHHFHKILFIKGISINTKNTFQFPLNILMLWFWLSFYWILNDKNHSNFNTSYKFGYKIVWNHFHKMLLRVILVAFQQYKEHGGNYCCLDDITVTNKTKQTRGVSHYGLSIYIKIYI